MKTLKYNANTVMDSNMWHRAEQHKACADLHDQLGKKLDMISNNLCERLTQLEYTLHSLMDARELRTTKATSSSTLNGRQNAHLTGCHNLIKSWPSVRDLLTQLGLDIDEEYVMKAEISNPPPFNKQRPVSIGQFRSNEATTQCCEQKQVKISPQLLANSLFEADVACKSCAGFMLDEYFESSAAGRLLRSYVQHIHIMHPILDLTFVNDVFQRFEFNIISGHQPRKCEDMKVNSSTQPRPKRPRTSECCKTNTCRSNDTVATETRLSLEGVLVLLILALGEVCESKQVSQDFFRHGLRHTSRTETTGQQCHCTIHAPYPPGIACYDRAMEAIGCHIDGYDLLHAQIYILAGLYKGQLGRASESLHWYCMAGRICQTLLFQSNLVRFDHSINRNEVQQIAKQRQNWIVEPAHDLVVLSSWTCLQLESDILADLPLPSSGLERYEDVIPWPLHVPGHTAFESLFRSHSAFEPVISGYDMLLHYTAQIWLRKLLNRIQRQLHGSECLHLSHEELRNVVRNHQRALQLWRTSLPAALCWSDDNVPASNILAARLRAKYWGACVVANRPILDYAIHIMPNVKQKSDIESVAVDARGAPRRKSEIELFKSIFDMPEDEISRAVKLCLQAAVHSTLAFDGVSGMPIVTNTFGTAHA
jgi:hypothetical protein